MTRRAQDFRPRPTGTPDQAGCGEATRTPLWRSLGSVRTRGLGVSWSRNYSLRRLSVNDLWVLIGAVPALVVFIVVVLTLILRHVL